MKVTFSDQEKKIYPFIGIAILLVLYVLNRMYVKITDIAYINGIPFEIEIKCGYIFADHLNLLLSSKETVRSKKYGHSFYIKGDDLYKNGKKVITFKTDQYYQQSKTTPLIKI